MNKKILILSLNNPLEYTGGAERYSVDLMNFFNSKKIDAKILYIRGSAETIQIKKTTDDNIIFDIECYNPDLIITSYFPKLINYTKAKIVTVLHSDAE
jgi:hypothetical protein